METTFTDRLKGCILGTAVGDSLGLPAEGLSRKRNRKIFKGHWRQRFLFGKGMWSDDTEHTFFVAQALIQHHDDVDGFRKALARKLKFWFLGLPAGVGLATARSSIKLLLGANPKRSGVFSAGNGPAMRSAIIGAYFHQDEKKIIEFVKASTLMTHSDPKAYVGALAVALASAFYINHPEGENESLLKRLREIPEGQDFGWEDIVDKIGKSLNKGDSMDNFLERLQISKGVSGYILHTVPVALYSLLKHPVDFKQALTDVLDSGGDTDTVGAIFGAMAGSRLGVREIPKEWIAGIREWPRTVSSLNKVAEALADKTGKPVKFFWPALLPRNLFFFFVVLTHGLRRLLPPY